MTKSTSKKRLSVPLSLDIYDRLDSIAQLRGVSMATTAAFFLAEKIQEFENAQTVLSPENMQKIIMEQYEKELVKKDLKERKEN